MISYLLRRVCYSIPILFGVTVITFILFFMVNSPDDMARMQLGNKNVTVEAINNWKVSKGYDKPLFFAKDLDFPANITNTIFYTTTSAMLHFNFGKSDAGRDINADIAKRMWPSLAIAVPSLLFGIILNIAFAIFVVFFRDTKFENVMAVFFIMLMSISGLFYIIIAQFVLGKVLKILPISGFVWGLGAIKFVILPIVVALISGLGSGVRWYRTLLLEECHKPYVLTAKAKGLSPLAVLTKHVLPNTMIAVATSVVAILPLLFLGSLITESFFGIPGLGSYTIDAITNQDFAVVRVIIFLGAILYMLGLILTDVVYTILDPRIRLK